MNKSEVCVKLTRKNCKKVLGILEMFGEPIYHGTRDSLKEGDYKNEGHPFLYFDGEEWDGHGVEGCKSGKTLIKPRELRNILAKEHLRKGYIVILSTHNAGDTEYIVEFNRVVDSSYPFAATKWVIKENRNIITGRGFFLNFLRYATDEEKALLEPKTTIVTLNPVATFTGYVPRQATYAHEVWVNHYSDREFYVHYDEQSAYMSIGRRGEGTTVKATLTYDIPMTKV